LELDGSPLLTAGVAALFLIVALLYSSVGHGGASGYLAVMALTLSLSPAEMSTTALVLNVLVAGMASLSYWRAGYLSGRLTWPFSVTSVPAALLGGLAPVGPSVYSGFLAAVLLFAAIRLALVSGTSERRLSLPRLPVSLGAGAAIGLLSGIVGVGGGIFLSPLAVLARWADAKTVAATSAVFIVINSLAGLAGRALAGRFEVGPMAPLVAAAFVGGLVGSYLGARYLSGTLVRRLLAVVLLLAGAKLAAQMV
jgi:uncharacterized membrane protein YfcA